MCGIFIWNSDLVMEVLLNQVDRGLEGMGIITSKNTHRTLKKDYKEYKKFLENKFIPWELVVMHHRKASIWKICLDNTHPFQGTKFQLIHNGSTINFFRKYSDIYKKETDSENLLKYIEDKAENLREIPAILKELFSDLNEEHWIIIIVHKNYILFYCDGSKESYIEIKNNRVLWIYNYKPNHLEGYSNKGYIILDFNYNIIENTFLEINKEEF